MLLRVKTLLVSGSRVSESTYSEMDALTGGADRSCCHSLTAPSCQIRQQSRDIPVTQRSVSKHETRRQIQYTSATTRQGSNTSFCAAPNEWHLFWLLAYNKCQPLVDAHLATLPEELWPPHALSDYMSEDGACCSAVLHS